MILSDKTIRRMIDDGNIRIRPDIREEQIQPASLDVRLGQQIYDPSRDETYIDCDKLILEPGRAYLGHTMDEVSLPLDVAAQLTGRSSLGRKGIIIHKTAGWIDPGFSGEITLELYNFSDSAVELDVGSRIGQLVFFRLDQISHGYDGQYQGQRGITKSGEW